MTRADVAVAIKYRLRIEDTIGCDQFLNSWRIGRGGANEPRSLRHLPCAGALPGFINIRLFHISSQFAIPELPFRLGGPNLRNSPRRKCRNVFGLTPHGCVAAQSKILPEPRGPAGPRAPARENT